MGRPFLTAVLALAAVAPHAAAHVGPSPETNNRYYRLTALGDRVRLGYTVFLGDAPGAAVRRRLDRDRDGRIDDAEARPIGDEVAAGVDAAVAVVIDGAPVAVQWSEPRVGLGAPVTAAGSLSVDLIGWVCLPRAGTRLAHRVVVRDRYRLPPAGEAELRLEGSPGVSIPRAGLGPDPSSTTLDLAWGGPPGPMAKAGYVFDLEIDPELATAGADSVCAPPPPPARPWWRRVLLWGAVLAAAGALTGLALRLGRSRAA